MSWERTEAILMLGHLLLGLRLAAKLKSKWGYGGLNDAYHNRRFEWLRALEKDYEIEL